jgi:hypothetical protein
MDAVNPHLNECEVRLTAYGDKGTKADCPFDFTIKPDLSVFAKEQVKVEEKGKGKEKGPTLSGVDWSRVELFIEVKGEGKDPFNTKMQAKKSGRSDKAGGTICELKEGVPKNPFVKTSQEALDICGQITSYATTHMSVQYRTHIFLVLICHKYARLMRWDRSGAIVTAPTYYMTEPQLFDFFVRFDRLSPEERGHDTTVRRATEMEGKEAMKSADELKEWKDRLLVVSIPNGNGEDGGGMEYVVGPPSMSPWMLVGRWTRTSIGYDVLRKKKIFMKDSWRLVLEGVPKEGDVYSRFEKNEVKNVPRCSNSGDIGEDKRHRTQTKEFVEEEWVWKSEYKYDLTTHRHYRLVLDDIGKRLDRFKRSSEMVRAVWAALIGE